MSQSKNRKFLKMTLIQIIVHQRLLKKSFFGILQCVHGHRYHSRLEGQHTWKRTTIDPPPSGQFGGRSHPASSSDQNFC